MYMYVFDKVSRKKNPLQFPRVCLFIANKQLKEHRFQGCSSMAARRYRAQTCPATRRTMNIF